jgi:hypothetical protein
MIKPIAEKAYGRIAGGLGIFVAAMVTATAAHVFIPLDGNSWIAAVIDFVGILAPFVLLLASAVVFGRGCWMYAVAKGHPGPLGLIGLMPFIGWIVLCILPDNRKLSDVEGFPVIDPKVVNSTLNRGDASARLSS